MLYLRPYGSSQPENLERIADNVGHTSQDVADGPMFVCYDQEPIIVPYNFELLDHVKQNCQGPFILVTTEKNSQPLEQIQQRYGWPTVYYFHHAFAAHDWFRGYQYDVRLIDPDQRQLRKKYISFNRITGSARVYRTLLLSELVAHDILDQGHVSFNDVCCENQLSYTQNLQLAVRENLITQRLADQANANLSTVAMPLRIDYVNEKFIPNHSFVLSAVEATQESFCYLVTETCFWEHKHHLTEKIFKPIVSRMPFVLAGPAHNLKYLREYGFQTFGHWIDESYDDIEDPVLRIQAIGRVMQSICNRSLSELETMLSDMMPVLEHNYQRFYSQEFLDHCWSELRENLSQAVSCI